MDHRGSETKMVHAMDAHIVGAVPPYSQLLGGKVVASLMTSQEVCEAFSTKYSDSQGIISGQRKQPRLSLLTVTSALGRSSLYNRLKLPGTVDFHRIGMTEGWGHFQIPEKLFLDMRKLLELEKHAYASNYQFGQGPNWRLRTVRLVLTKIGLNRTCCVMGLQEKSMHPLWQKDGVSFDVDNLPPASFRDHQQQR